MLKLLALQDNSTGSVLTNDGMLGEEVRDLKPGVAALAISLHYYFLNTLEKVTFSLGFSFTLSVRFNYY